MPRAFANILVVKTHAIGDYLMTTAALRDLRAAHPSARITLLIGAWSAAAARGNPHVDEVLEFDDRILLGGRRREFPRLLRDLRRRRFDCAVLFHTSPFIHCMAWLAGIPVRYGMTRDGRDLFLTAGSPENLEPDFYYGRNYQGVAALAGAVTGDETPEVHPGAEDVRAARALLGPADWDSDAAYLVIAPGGSRNSNEEVAARRWPAARFAELLAGVRRDYPALRIVLAGAASDAGETGLLAAAFPEAIDLTGKTTLPQLFAVVARARAVVCNDSSLLHVAMACRKPAVVPFGPTGAAERLPAWALPYAVQSGIPCSPCYVKGNFPGCTIGFECLREMPVSAVRARLDRALAKADARPA